jgi:nucleotide-binding universal stress UspA family protein
MPRISRILVPTDFSAYSRAAVDLACELSSRLGVPLTILHAYALPAYPLPEGSILPPSAERATEIVSHATVSLQSEVERARALGVDADTVIVEGEALHAIERTVADRNIDLIVMGTHGRRGIAHAVLGSLAEKLVQRGPCAVLTVHEDAT